MNQDSIVGQASKVRSKFIEVWTQMKVNIIDYSEKYKPTLWYNFSDFSYEYELFKNVMFLG